MSTNSAEQSLRKYSVKNLGCADCAAKMQQRFQEEPGLQDAILNFNTATILVNPSYLNRAEEIMGSIETGVEIVSEDAASDPKQPIFAEYRRDLLVMATAAILFGFGLVFRAELQQTPYSFGEYAVFLSAYLLVGRPVLAAAFRNLKSGYVFDENFLMTLATVGAILIHELPEAVGVMLFYYIGEFFQNLAVNKSRRSIKSLMDIRPETANLLSESGVDQVPPGTVQPGDHILVKPGERVPLDGVVVKGTSFMDTSALTGESVPRRTSPGDQVMAGMVNADGMLTVEVTREFAQSSVSRILDLVENAASRKARAEKFITKFARYYTPAVVIAASAVAVVPPLFIPGATFSDWLYRALILLVISCPCALVVSIPLGYFAGVGSASRQGVLVKGAQFLEALTDLHTVVFDKTGTLSKGVFKVTDIRPEPDFDKETLLRLAAEAEVHSNHPIAVSIRDTYDGKIDQDEITDYQELPGHGIRAKIQGRTVLAGNSRLLESHGLTPAVSLSAGTTVHLAVDGKYAGFLVISDELKENAPKTISGLKKLRVKKTVMLSGDEESVAKQVASELGIDEVHANLLPEDKLDHLESIISRVHAENPKGRVAFVGDGINDAPVISRADVGIAMGGIGSDAAMEAADVVIIQGQPEKVVTGIKIARRTRTIVMQNLIFALGVKALFILFGIAGMATMWEAVFADVGVALIAVFNSTRALRLPE